MYPDNERNQSWALLDHAGKRIRYKLNSGHRFVCSVEAAPGSPPFIQIEPHIPIHAKVTYPVA